MGHGWSDEQLAEAFAYLGLAVYTSYFLNYAATDLDIPTALPGSSRQLWSSLSRAASRSRLR